MTNRRRIEEMVLKKEQEIQELEVQLREAKSYVQALQDVMKRMPRDDDEVTADGDSAAMRPGSYAHDAKEAIHHAGRPLHVVEILKASNRPNDRKNRLGMSGALAAYVRRKDAFTRPKPNTFGLIDMPRTKPSEAANLSSASPSPPDDFGMDDEVPFGDDEEKDDAAR